MSYKWNNVTTTNPQPYKCGYCQKLISSEKCFFADHFGGEAYPWKYTIFIFPHCDKPTFIQEEFTTKSKFFYPSPTYGDKVDHIPKDVEQIYNEARRCMKSNAHTASVLCCRKLLMHLAVEEGAKENLKFFQYVNYLADKGYVPPNGKEWVEYIKDKGNEANHEIVMMSQKEAEKLIDFLEMLLKFIYEFQRSQ